MGGGTSGAENARAKSRAGWDVSWFEIVAIGPLLNKACDSSIGPCQGLAYRALQSVQKTHSKETTSAPSETKSMTMPIYIGRQEHYFGTFFGKALTFFSIRVPAR